MQVASSLACARTPSKACVDARERRAAASKARPALFAHSSHSRFHPAGSPTGTLLISRERRASSLAPRGMASSGSMLSVHVQVEVKADCVDGFVAASLANATNSVQEAGISRFDLIQEADAPTKFQLVEIYSAADAPAKHKETAHYNAWRDAVADMMQVPRTNVK